MIKQLAEQFSVDATSGFTAEVTEGGENNFTFDLQP